MTKRVKKATTLKPETEKTEEQTKMDFKIPKLKKKNLRVVQG